MSALSDRTLAMVRKRLEYLRMTADICPENDLHLHLFLFILWRETLEKDFVCGDSVIYRLSWSGERESDEFDKPDVEQVGGPVPDSLARLV